MLSADGSPHTLGPAQGIHASTRVFPTAGDAVDHVVSIIRDLILECGSAGRPCVLGLPVGSTPVSVYRELVRLHKDEGLDFSHVITFNTDEYYSVRADQVQSRHRLMKEQLFDHVNIKPDNVHIPDGAIPVDQIENFCANFEEKIRQAGGIDLTLLGIGRTAHIGFNEPGCPADSKTRLVRLDPVTRRDAADVFFAEENVPTHALTMGIGTILGSKRIVLLAFGEHKSEVIKEVLEQGVSSARPASHLQSHSDAVFVIDQPAASRLTVSETPWLVEQVEWTDQLIRKAVLWLSMQSQKALLKLNADDFRQFGLHELLREHGPAHQLCQKIFNEMNVTICTAPGGESPNRIICFSPHPDDDVISMGGTLIRLVQHKHEVHVAYMTSGNVAVFDHDALRFANFVADFNELFGIESDKTNDLEAKVHEFLQSKQPGQVDSPEVLAIKGLIRKSEAITAAKSIDIAEECLHFLDMPFYRTGRAGKKSIAAQDVEIVLTLLQNVKPQQIYVAGDLADPHGTHRLCAQAIFRAVQRYRDDGGALEVWMYRGAWQEWEPHQIERAVPLSPDDIERKRMAIFHHESQKDRAMFPGPDEREFWQRAEERNKSTAQVYDQLGLPEFYAMEGFVLWKGTQL